MIWKDPGGQAKLVSRSVAAKLKTFFEGKQFLYRLIANIPEIEQYEFISNFDDFGDKGISSYIAIVHADGNRMGERIKELGKNLSFPDQNREYIQLLRAFSSSSKAAANNALTLTIKKLISSIQTDKSGNFIRRKQEVSPEQLQTLPKVSIVNKKLPFRPIVFGGDDITFICDGRLGLAMAKEYLQNYHQQVLEEGFAEKKHAVGRAGIAIIPSHYPFSRGYELAEDLAGSAKGGGQKGFRQSLDWHFGTNGIVEPLSTIRARSYRADGKKLAVRPVPLSDPTANYDFATLEYLIKEFQVGAKWSGRRNKVKALYPILRQGGDKVQTFLASSRLPELPVDDKLRSLGKDILMTGYSGDQCYYFDALEAMDFHIPLEG